ncbi:helix-hairpin-helix domain-containing protein [Myxococcota bacterium]|nr:helix-hairpin-helix domain-containing protein [Myxococcota bacterium]
MGLINRSFAVALTALVLGASGGAGCAGTQGSGPLGWLGFGRDNLQDWKVDVNTATAEELAQLPGVTPQMAANIISYRERQGLIEDEDELGRVRGMTPEVRRAIKDQVVLGKVDINQATADQLVMLPQVTPRLADNLLAHRQKYGRFENWGEVEKVQGFNRDLVRKVDDVGFLGRLNVNAASAEQLREIRGIDADLASNIVQYRDRAGRFSSADELLQVLGMDPARLDTIRGQIVLGPATHAEAGPRIPDGVPGDQEPGGGIPEEGE